MWNESDKTSMYGMALRYARVVDENEVCCM